MPREIRLCIKLLRLPFKLLRLPFKLLRLFSFVFIAGLLILGCATTTYAAENNSETVSVEPLNALDTSKAQNIDFVEFDETQHLCSVTFRYFCNNLNYSTILYIEDTKTKELYYCSSFVLDSETIQNAEYCTKNFLLPNGTYNLYAGFTGLPLDKEGMLTYMPTGRLDIHNNTTSSIDAVVTMDMDFYYRAKNIILLNPRYTSIVDDTLSNILHAEQEGRTYTSEQIYKLGIATQYNDYKDNKYSPKETEYFRDISVITPTKCEIDPSINVYKEYYEEITDPNYYEELLKEEATREETTVSYDTPTKNESTASSDKNNNLEENTSNNNEASSIKPFETLSQENTSEEELLTIDEKKQSNIYFYVLLTGLAFLLIGGGVFFIVTNIKNNKNNKIEL